MFIKKKTETITTLESLRKGPVIKNNGIKHIKNAGKVISIFSLKLDINLIKKS